MGGPEMAPQTPQPLVAPRRSRGAPRPHTLVAPRRSRGAPRPHTLVAPRRSRGAPRPHTLVAPRRSRGAPRPHTLVAPRRSRGAPRPHTLVAPRRSRGTPRYCGRGLYCGRVMPRINEHYLNLRAAYLFAEIRRRQKAFGDAHPEARVIDLGVGDVTRPLPPAVVRALHEAADDMARPETFKGYGPYVGYEWLRAEIAAQDFGTRGVTLTPDEIFISDGGKSDSASLQEIFAQDAVVAVMDPVYPVYADANVVAGRTGAADETGRYTGMVYLPCVAENGFQPALPERHVDLIYLCYPNNPTGAVATREALARWVEYARAEDAVILYDAAYEGYIVGPEVPHSIYEIDGAREVAIECRSFSENAGFTGMRLAYTVVPKELRGSAPDGTTMSLNALWARRTAIKSNGLPYVIQRAAAAVYTPEGRKQVRALIDFYM